MNRIISHSLAIVIFVLIFISPGPVCAGTIEGKVKVAPGKIVTPEEESIISLSAARALYHIARARYAIHQQDPDLAIDELGKSLTAMKQIKTALPTAKVKDDIRIAIFHIFCHPTSPTFLDRPHTNYILT